MSETNSGNILQFFRERTERRNRFKLPLSPEEAAALSDDDTGWLEQQEQNWNVWNVSPQTVVRWTKELMRSVSLGEIECPACGNRDYFPGVERGEVTGILRRIRAECRCARYRFIQRLMNESLPAEYREVSLGSLQPSPKSQLTLAKQAHEIALLRQHAGNNHMFLGPAGTSKTTFAVALYRAAFWRHHDFIMRDGFRLVPPKCRIAFAWMVNGEDLFSQYHQWKTTMTSANPAPEPCITVRKIQKAASKGLRPTLILEEMDKVHMTEPRVNVLFGLIDAIDGAKGQLVITTNRTFDRFVAIFSESELESVRVSGEPLIRRVLKNCNIHNYFEHKGE